MRLDRAGRFLATTIDQGIEQKATGSVQFGAKFRITHEKISGQWVAVDPCEIDGWANLVMKNGSVNEATVERLKAAYGWDGADPCWLQDSDLGGVSVQLTVDWGTDQNNNPRLEVRFIDSADATGGGIRRADDAAKRAIREQFGAKFRALSGGTSAMPPVPPKAAAPAPAPKAPAAPPAKRASMEDAWEAFTRQYRGDAAKREDEWWAILRQQFPSRIVPGDIGADEWGRLVADMATLVNVPF